MRFPYGAALTAAFLLVAAASPAQSLSDAAAKEKARRKTVAKPAKVVTEDDLRRGGGLVSSTGTEGASEGKTPAATAPGEGGAAGGAKKEKTEDEQRTQAQAAWRKKLDAANQEAVQARDLVGEMQLQLNDTSGGVYTPRRAGLQTQLDDARKRLAEADGKVASLGEEGRRNGWR